MAQRMRLAQQEAQRTAAELNALSEVHQRLRFGDESRLAQYAMRPGTSIYQGQFDLAARLQGVNYGPMLARQQAEANIAGQAQAQLAEAEFNRRMQAEIATRRTIRPEVMGDLQRRAGFQGGELLTSSIRLEPILDKQGRVVGQNAQAFIRMADGQTRAISTNDTFQQSVTRGSGALEGFGRRVAGIASGILVWEAFRTATGTVEDMHRAIAELSTETVRFGLVTGESIGQAIDHYLQLQSVSTAQGILPTEIAPVVQRAARFAPEDQAGQANLVRGASIFANLFGINPERSIEILSAALKQQGLEASNTMDVLDQLIAVYRTSVGSVNEVSNALTEAPTIQSKWGTEYQETVGLIAEVSGTVDESAETVTNALIRITDVLEGLSGEKAIEFARSFQEMGITVQDSSGNLLDPLAMIENISSSFGTLEPEMQSQALGLLGLLKPTYQQVGRGLMGALADGQISNINVIHGAGEKAGQEFLDSYGGQLQKARALQQEVFQQAGAGAGFISRIVTGTFELVGEPQIASQINQALLTAEIGSDETRDRFLRGLIGSEDDVRSKIISQLYQATQALAGTGTTQGIQVANELMSNQATIVETAIKRWRELNVEMGKIDASPAEALAQRLLMAIEDTKSKMGLVPETTAPGTEVQANRLRDEILFRGSQDVFPTSAVDLTTFSQEQYNQALSDSEARFNAILEAQIEEMRLAGLTTDQIQEQVDKIRDAADATFVLVELEGKRFEYAKGTQALFLQDEARREKAREKEAGSDFAFRRLKDVDPSQFGQLQALTQMYNAMLTRLGSPEEEKNINLLLGEQNVFKQLTGRMSALQLALEDLTKVEKAQLSGTWNLPSGATALVPISSLDIQRWNGQGGGGGMTPEALMAFLQQFAGMLGGGAGGGAGAPAEAPRRRGAPSNLLPSPEEMRQGEEERREEQLRRRRARGFGQPAPTDPDTGRDTGSMSDELRSRAGRAEAARIETIVNVAMLPIKATIAVNIPVLLNGQVIARIVQQLFYQWFTRQTRSSPTRANNTVGGVRG